MKKAVILLFSIIFFAATAEAGSKDAKFKHVYKNKDGVIDKKKNI